MNKEQIYDVPKHTHSVSADGAREYAISRGWRVTCLVCGTPFATGRFYNTRTLCNKKSCQKYPDISKMDADGARQMLMSEFQYNPDTGEFTRKRSNSVAGSKHKKGHIIISVTGLPFYAHRLAWLYMTGSWPKEQIDHINGIKSDNRFCNLRDVPSIGNSENRTAPSRRNTCGFLGVTKSSNAKSNIYRAQIHSRGKNYHLGSFGTPQEAHDAYVKAKRKLHTFCTL